jgi:hypothetical protein
MITAEKLRALTTMGHNALTQGIQLAGYKKDKFHGCKFLGMTNAGLFCYAVAFVEDGNEHETKVFVKYDPTADRVSVDY